MTISSGYSKTFNYPEDCVDKETNSHQVSVTPSPRKKQKKFVDTKKKQSSGNSMYGVLWRGGFALIFCENGNALCAKITQTLEVARKYGHLVWKSWV